MSDKILWRSGNWKIEVIGTATFVYSSRGCSHLYVFGHAPEEGKPYWKIEPDIGKPPKSFIRFMESHSDIQYWREVKNIGVRNEN